MLVLARSKRSWQRPDVWCAMTAWSLGGRVWLPRIDKIGDYLALSQLLHAHSAHRIVETTLVVPLIITAMSAHVCCWS